MGSQDFHFSLSAWLIFLRTKLSIALTYFLASFYWAISRTWPSSFCALNNVTEQWGCAVNVERMNANLLNKTLAIPAEIILVIPIVTAGGEGSQVAYLRPYTTNSDPESRRQKQASYFLHQSSFRTVW